MAALIEFETSKFDLSSEPENEFNPIHGQSILLWIMENCPDVSFVGQPNTEDWGWYIDAITNERRYMVGASANWDNTKVAWCVVQIEKQRSLIEKIFRKEKMHSQDALVQKISKLFLHDSNFQNVVFELEKA